MISTFVHGTTLYLFTAGNDTCIDIELSDHLGLIYITGTTHVSPEVSSEAAVLQSLSFYAYKGEVRDYGDIPGTRYRWAQYLYLVPSPFATAPWSAVAFAADSIRLLVCVVYVFYCP